MAYWRLRRTFTVPDVLGFSLASSGNPGIDGNYYRTSQTNNGAPVFLRAAAGAVPAMYLFYSYGMGSGWFLKDSVEASMEDWDDPSGMKSYSGFLEIMDYDVNATKPDAAMLTGTWGRNDGNTGSYSVTATELLDTAAPLLDGAGTDGYGRARRFPAALDIPREGLVFDAQFTHEISRAATGQALTCDIEVPSGEPASPWRADVGGLPCVRTYYGRDGGVGGISFPDDALNGNRKSLTVSAWVNVVVNSVYEASYWFHIGDSSSGYLNFGIEGDTYYDGKPNLAVHGQYPGGAIEANKWYHVVFAFTGRSIIAYLNGIFTGTCTCDVDVSKSGTAYIGRKPDGSGSLGGFLAGIRIYNRVLSEAEIGRLFDEHREVVS